MSFNLRRRNKKNSNPFVGILFGLGLFLGSFVLLYFNEGRVDLSKIAADSIAVSADSVSSDNQEKLVAVSGTLHADDPVGDPELLRSGRFLQLERTAEMYAWREASDKDDESGVKEFEYKRDWTSTPENSQNFNNPNGHFNPFMQYSDEAFTVPSVSLGAFNANTGNLFFMQKEDLVLTEGMLAEGHLVDNYIFIGEGTLDDPEVGDLRIAYEGFANEQSVTLFAEQYENQLRPFTQDDTVLFRVYPSDRESAIASMRTEFLTLIWGFRVGGLLLMWIGLMTIVSPVTRLLGYLPLVGDAGRFVISIIAFAIAFVLSLITIVVSAILHSPIALITIFILVIAGGVFLWRKRE
ncbi:MAG: hypothetical protein GY943_02465 [Chloroflexi bacterium]|nr:hypothetical protein [Chloroflexota bacterium]